MLASPVPNKRSVIGSGTGSGGVGLGVIPGGVGVNIGVGVGVIPGGVGVGVIPGVGVGVGVIPGGDGVGVIPGGVGVGVIPGGVGVGVIPGGVGVGVSLSLSLGIRKEAESPRVPTMHILENRLWEHQSAHNRKLRPRRFPTSFP